MIRLEKTLDRRFPATKTSPVQNCRRDSKKPCKEKLGNRALDRNRRLFRDHADLRPEAL